MKFLSTKLLVATAVLGALVMPILASAHDMAEQTAQTDWLSVYSESEDGGFVIGNPDAQTRLVEYASYTCGHCAKFEALDAQMIKQANIANGTVSFEIRSLVRDVVDLTTAMLARCGGKDSFFAAHQFLMANQGNINSRTSRVTPETAKLLDDDNFNGFMVAAYAEMNLGELMQQLGVSDIQAKACLADKAALDRLLATSDAAMPTYGINALKFYFSYS